LAFGSWDRTLSPYLGLEIVLDHDAQHGERFFALNGYANLIRETILLWRGSASSALKQPDRLSPIEV